MDYETERQRMASLLSESVGISRIFVPELNREADERASEARQQVGLNATGTDADKIVHPPQAEREARLGPNWSGMQVAELANWLYAWNDPVKALVDATNFNGEKVGYLNTEPHNSILRDRSFKYWGIGFHTELPPGLQDDPVNVRWYNVIWLSRNIPVPPPNQTFSDVPPNHPFYNDIEWMAKEGITAGIGGGLFNPKGVVTREQMAAFLHRALGD
jgi:hypothetical protein